MTSDTRRWDALVVGGGLAGLAAGTYLARQGHKVLVLERAGNPGGRAQTRVVDGFFYNQGPHALYRGGAAESVLTDLGVTYTGGTPNVAGSAIRNGRAFTMPVGSRSLMTTRLFGVKDRVEAGRLALSFRRLAGQESTGVSVAQWLDRESTQPAARQYMEALVRLSCYADAPETIDVTDAARQFVYAGGGVRYLDGGWATLVEGLRARLWEAGGRLETGSRVARVGRKEEGWTVELSTGASFSAGTVILAVAPAVAAELASGIADLAGRAVAAVPARAACLDVSLSKMPLPRRRFGLGIDVPLYYSVHTKVARLAPGGLQTISVAKYLHPEASHDPAGSLVELEGLLDLLQPGWREFEVGRQFLPEMTVTTALPSAGAGGLGARPGPGVAGAPGIFVAGDWVGNHGWLADSTMGSAREASQLADAYLRAGVHHQLAGVS